VDPALEAERDQARQQAGVVDVGVGEDDEIDRAWIEIESTLVLGAGLAPALEHAAIDQKTYAVRFHQIAGAGDFTRRAEKGQFHSVRPSPASS